MVYQCDRFFGYGYWMTSIPTITHILIFCCILLGYCNIWIGCHANQLGNSVYPKNIKMWVMVRILVIHQPSPKSLSFWYTITSMLCRTIACFLLCQDYHCFLHSHSVEVMVYVTTRIFLQHTSDVWSDSRCPTPCNGCSILYYRTPCAQLGQVFWCFPFCYDSNISLIYCRHLVGLQTSNSAQWPRHFLHYRTTCAQLSQVFRCFPFLLRFKYFWYTADVRLCAMAAVFLHYQTTRAQFGRMFRCFPFITFHLSFFQIHFHSYLAYLISDISRGTCI